MDGNIIFRPLRLGRGLELKNRLLRSSVGGRTCNFDGSVTDVWKNFELRFAHGGVGAIISTTFHVNNTRLSPLQYPSLAEDRYVAPLARGIRQIQDAGCRYIVQIGDPGYSTYSSLFAESADGQSAIGGIDLGFGYTNRRQRMSDQDITRAIADYAAAARRAVAAGADGIEITATKGYLIHQFLNPGINRRTDDWGGTADKRFRLLEHIVRAVRAEVGPHCTVGIRLSGEDLNHTPVTLALLRWPPLFLSRERWRGNELPQMLDYGRRLQAMGVDYFHVVAGYGFPNPRDVPGRFPFDEIRMFFDSVRHLSFKAATRAALTHFGPDAFWRWFFNIGWHPGDAVNLALAHAFKAIGVPVIANGGFQDRHVIERALAEGRCDLVSMARALIRDPELPRKFADGLDAVPANVRCTQCNRCVGRTTTSPLGCYDESRFATRQQMVDQIMAFNRPDPVPPA